MKHVLTALSVAFALSAAASLGASAQEAKPRNIDEVLTNQRVRQLTSLLSLSEEQKQKAQAIVMEEFKSARAIKENEGIAQQEKFSKTDAIHAAAKAKIKEMLTPEQLVKWDALEQNAAKKKKK